MPQVRRSLLLTGAVVLLAGCGFETSAPREAAPKQPVTRAQLAAMVLPKADLGPSVKGLAEYRPAGEMTNARFASSTVDPEDTASSLRAKGRVLGFERTYIHPRLASLSVRKGTLSLGTGVELLDDPVYAVQYLHARLTDYERLRGPVRPGIKLRNVSSFEIAAIGDEGGGVRATVIVPSLIRAQETSVMFRRGRVVAYVSVVRADKGDARQEALSLAVELDRRIQAVLAGEIEVKPVKPDGLTVANRAARKKLPAMTMAAEDVAADARVYEEGRVDGDGYSAYQRVFKDVVVGGSHLVALRAETQLYDTPASAVLGMKFVDRPGGRQVYAQGVVQSFAEETSVRPTNVRVSPLRNPGRGMKGIAVTFELVGAKFRMASIFMRSGRFVQSVTGICRVEAFDPGDLKPLAQRVQVRLLAA
jgi:hypothetical protein